jgi:DNA polymerase-3 subunit epsilon
MTRDELLCFIDVETTGREHERHAVIQIAGTLAELCEGSVCPLSSFDFSVAPHRGAEILEDALKVNGRTQEEIMTYDPPEVVHKKFTRLLGQYCDKYNPKDKYKFVAYNADFDFRFMRSFFERVGDKYFGSWFWAPPYCVMQLANFGLMAGRRDLPNFKLGTVAEHTGVTATGRLHDASVDIALTRGLFEKFYLPQVHG